MRRAGFTILETVIALGITIMLVLVGWEFARNILSFNTTAYDSLSAQAELLKIVNVWSNEIRTAVPAETGAYPLLTAATNTLTFYSDIDDDGVVERVRYFLSGSKLRKGIIEPSGSPFTYNTASETIADQVQNVVASATGIFQYYDSSYTGAASSTAPLVNPVNISKVRLVKITIDVDRDAKHTPATIQVSTQVSFRNLKDNQ